jgi:hypothetical protein
LDQLSTFEVKTALGQIRTSVNGRSLSGFAPKADQISPSSYVSYVPNADLFGSDLYDHVRRHFLCVVGPLTVPVNSHAQQI